MMCTDMVFLILSLVLLIYGFPCTVLVLPLVSQSLFAQIPFVNRSIFRLRRRIIILILVVT